MWAIETSWWICLSKKVIIKTRDHPIHTHIAIKIEKNCILKNIGTFLKIFLLIFEANRNVDFDKKHFFSSKLEHSGLWIIFNQVLLKVGSPRNPFMYIVFGALTCK